MMPNYVCTQLDIDPLSSQQTCQTWAEYVPPVATTNSPWEQLNSLSQADATSLLVQTVLLWTIAWGWNFLGKFSYR